MKKATDIAIFDLDNTLLCGDSDYLWGRFLVEQGRVDSEFYEQENQRFYDAYKAGNLDILEFLAFALRPLADIEPAALATLHRTFMATKIMPVIPQATRDLLQQHREKGHFLLIITATNSFVTQPIADELGVDHLLATDPEMANGRYTGAVTGTPCFQHGKVERLEAWLSETGRNLASSWFYSDSLNDLPLLEKVTHPIAVSPDDTLKYHAETKGWPIISLCP